MVYIEKGRVHLLFGDSVEVGAYQVGRASMLIKQRGKCLFTGIPATSQYVNPIVQRGVSNRCVLYMTLYGVLGDFLCTIELLEFEGKIINDGI